MNKSQIVTPGFTAMNSTTDINKTDQGNVSDGYHTFNDLYHFRMIYNAALFNSWWSMRRFNIHKSRRHNDGEECFGGGWFIFVAVLPTGMISNHYKEKYWDLFHIPDYDKALVPFDGHTAQDVIDRLEAFIKTDSQ